MRRPEVAQRCPKMGSRTKTSAEVLKGVTRALESVLREEVQEVRNAVGKESREERSCEEVVGTLQEEVLKSSKRLGLEIFVREAYERGQDSRAGEQSRGAKVHGRKAPLKDNISFRRS